MTNNNPIRQFNAKRVEEAEKTIKPDITAQEVAAVLLVTSHDIDANKRQHDREISELKHRIDNLESTMDSLQRELKELSQRLQRWFDEHR